MQTIKKWKKYQRSQEFLDKVKDGEESAVVTIENDEIFVNGEQVNKMTQEMIDFSSQQRQIDYIRYSMIQFTWELVETFLPTHPVKNVLEEIKENFEPTLGQVLCK